MEHQANSADWSPSHRFIRSGLRACWCPFQKGYSLDRPAVHTGPLRDDRDEQQSTLKFTPRGSLDSSVNITCVILDYERKPGYTEETHAYNSIQKVSTPNPGIVPGTSLLWVQSCVICRSDSPSGARASKPVTRRTVVLFCWRWHFRHKMRGKVLLKTHTNKHSWNHNQETRFRVRRRSRQQEIKTWESSDIEQNM